MTAQHYFLSVGFVHWPFSAPGLLMSSASYVPISEAQAARFSVRYRETCRLDKQKKKVPPPYIRDEAEEGGAV